MLALGACVEGPPDPSARLAAAGLNPFLPPTAPVPFVSFARLGSAPVLTVYVEGDGRAWHRDRPPDDPTPLHPVALDLAIADPAPSVLYLGRPCQYGARTDPACDPGWWQGRRFAGEVIDALDGAVRAAERRGNARDLILVGYSGGGAVAALLAARHPETRLLVTVAGVLDTTGWTRRLNLAPLDGSLNPADQRVRLAQIRQIHLVGLRDEIVPPDLTRAFVTGLGPGAPATIDVQDREHDGDWSAGWRDRIAHWREE